MRSTKNVLSPIESKEENDLFSDETSEVDTQIERKDVMFTMDGRTESNFAPEPYKPDLGIPS